MGFGAVWVALFFGFAATRPVFFVMPLRGGEVLFLSGKSTQNRFGFFILKGYWLYRLRHTHSRAPAHECLLSRPG